MIVLLQEGRADDISAHFQNIKSIVPKSLQFMGNLIQLGCKIIWLKAMEAFLVDLQTLEEDTFREEKCRAGLEQCCGPPVASKAGSTVRQ